MLRILCWPQPITSYNKIQPQRNHLLRRSLLERLLRKLQLRRKLLLLSQPQRLLLRLLQKKLLKPHLKQLLQRRPKPLLRKRLKLLLRKQLMAHHLPRQEMPFLRRPVLQAQLKMLLFLRKRKRRKLLLQSQPLKLQLPKNPLLVAPTSPLNVKQQVLL